MLPISLVTQEKTLPARYVFAVATFRKFRGQGISSLLMEAAHAHMKEMGIAASLLVPASKSLFDFYGKRGYETRFWLDHLSLSAHDISQPPPEAIISPLRAEDYFRLRNQAFSGSALFARWDEEALAFIINSLNTPESGGALHIKTTQGEAGLLYEYRDGRVRVVELALKLLSWQTALALLHQRLKATAYTLRMPKGTLPGAETAPFGMVHWLVEPPAIQGEAPYLSLAKD